MRFSTLSLVLLATGVAAAPTPVAPDLLAGLRWRNLGPFRGGRISAVSGVGGQTWTKTLYVDDTTGLQRLAWAYDHPEVILAVSQRHYNPPPTGPLVVPPPGAGGPGGGAPQTGPTQTKLFKSTDKGLTWHEITGGGLPRLLGRTYVAVAMNTNAQRMFLIGNFGLYRSDDGGTTWRQMDAADRRIANGQGGYNCGADVDPQNPHARYTVNTAMYKSTDGGNTFTGFKG